MNRLVSALMLLTASISTVATTPLSPPKPYKMCTVGISHCAYVSPGNDAVVYKMEGEAFKATEIYRVPGWHRSAFLSNDGVYFLSGSPGLNLVSKNADKNTVILTVWRYGKKSFEVKLGHVLSSMDSLQDAMAHSFWGYNKGFTAQGLFEIDTVEDKQILVDPKTGAVSGL